MIIRHYVMRTHSHTDRQQLWKVMSRGFEHLPTARSWMRYCREMEENPNHEFFIVSKEEELDNEG